MASLIYDSFMDDLVRGKFNFDGDTIRVMLVMDAYVPNKGVHAKRSDVTSEVGVNNTGYATGGLATTPSLTLDPVTHREDISFSNVTWSNATITAKAAVLYKSNGGPASEDELIAYVDFGQNVSSTAAAFAVTFSSSLRLQN